MTDFRLSSSRNKGLFLPRSLSNTLKVTSPGLTYPVHFMSHCVTRPLDAGLARARRDHCVRQPRQHQARAPSPTWREESYRWIPGKEQGWGHPSHLHRGKTPLDTSDHESQTKL